MSPRHVSKTLVAGVLAVLAVAGLGALWWWRAAEERKVGTASATTDSTSRGGSRWGGDYFPNIPLVTHEGKKVRFFDDLIKDKIVVINFMFTSCPNACPLETARLVKIQQLLGDRVGRDVFMYSITIDPKNDTPDVLKDYAAKFNVKPGWLFLTGDKADITRLRKKLGLFIAEIEGPSNDHNLQFIIGNQATGRWMKRTPFETPEYVAAQIGSWLENWKTPTPNPNNYAQAPAVRPLAMGASLFQTRCSACHTIGQGELPAQKFAPLPGPDLVGVTDRRERSWLAAWIGAPDRMLAQKDPIAMELYAKYKNVPMPNMQLSQLEVDAVIDFIAGESERLRSGGTGNTEQ